MSWDKVDWTRPAEQVSRYFTVKDILFLPRLGRLATVADGVSDEVKACAYTFANGAADAICDVLGGKVNVHCWVRPKAYNKLVGGKDASRHLFGDALDFDAPGRTCDQVRTIFLDKYSSLKIRYEDTPGSNWVHGDTKPGARLGPFKP